MSDKNIKDENLDEIIKNVVKAIKNGKELPSQDLNKITSETKENLEFLKVIDDIKLESPNNRVIFIDGSEQLLYDNGEFFICETTDSRKPKRKIKRQEATEIYIEYFIRYQLNPIIEQKNMDNLSKTIEKIELVKEVKEKVKKVQKVAKSAPDSEAKKVTSSPEKVTKSKKSIER